MAFPQLVGVALAYHAVDELVQIVAKQGYVAPDDDLFKPVVSHANEPCVAKGRDL